MLALMNFSVRAYNNRHRDIACDHRTTEPGFITSWFIPILFGFVAFACTDLKDETKKDSKLCWITYDSYYGLYCIKTCILYCVFLFFI